MSACQVNRSERTAKRTDVFKDRPVVRCGFPYLRGAVAAGNGEDDLARVVALNRRCRRPALEHNCDAPIHRRCNAIWGEVYGEKDLADSPRLFDCGMGRRLYVMRIRRRQT